MGSENEAQLKATESATQEKKPTSEDFITRWPLYTPFDFVGYVAPSRVTFHCSGLACSKDTTWSLADRDYRASHRFYLVRYQCELCQKNSLSIIYREHSYIEKVISGPSGQESKWIVSKVQKIGQFPALAITIAKPLEKNLGETHADLYKKGLINRNEGYGLGAVSYMRRVVEDKTEELIEVVAQVAEAHSIEAQIIKKIRAAKEEKTTYDQKLRIAALAVPQSLIVDGVNPLDVLYALVSAGLHDLAEEECIAMADEIREVFEYTFTRLRAEIQSRKTFAEKIKKWAGTGTKKSVVDKAAG